MDEVDCYRKDTTEVDNAIEQDTSCKADTDYDAFLRFEVMLQSDGGNNQMVKFENNIRYEEVNQFEHITITHCIIQICMRLGTITDNFHLLKLT